MEGVSTVVTPEGARLPLWRLLHVDLMRAIYAHDYAGQSGAAWSSVIGVALSPEFAAVVLHRWASRAMPTPLRPLGWLCYLLSRYLTASDVSPFARIGPGFRIAHAAGVVVGERVVAGRNLTLFNSTNLGARLTGGRPGPNDGMPVLGDDVFVGAGARLLGPITVGDGAVIAANAVVVRDVAPRTAVAGVPARPVSG